MIQEIASPLASSQPRKSIANGTLTIMEAKTKVYSPTLLDLSVLQSRGISSPLPLFAPHPGRACVSSTSSASSSRSMRQTVGFRPMDFSSSQGVLWGYWSLFVVTNFDEYSLNINKTNQDMLLQVSFLPCSLPSCGFITYFCTSIIEL
jgi:hypothetical protein